MFSSYVKPRKYIQNKSGPQSQQMKRGRKKTQTIAEFEEYEGVAPIGPEEIVAIEKAMPSHL